MKLRLMSPIEIKIPYTKYFIGRQNVGEVRCQPQDLKELKPSSKSYINNTLIYFHLHPIGWACPIWIK
jgi:hypothetical protein